MVAAGLMTGKLASAVPLQSDDFQNALAPFWKVHQILRDTGAGQYGPAKAEASASAAVDDTSVDPGFQFAHFRLAPLGN
jgi:hypothetical protein